nr:uncharacterized protein LOC113805817 [Penaeus vannamei]
MELRVAVRSLTDGASPGRSTSSIFVENKRWCWVLLECQEAEEFVKKGNCRELDPKLPEFVCTTEEAMQRVFAPTARPARVLDYDGDDEWTPEKEQSSRYASKNGSVGSGRRGGHKRKAEWSAPAWARRSENYDDAPLSVDQVDVIPLWTPAKLVAGAKGTAKIMPTTVDRSSGASAAENVKPEDKGIFPGPMSHLATDTEMETVKELPAETKTLGVGSDEEGRGNSCFSGESKTRYPRRSSRRKLFYEENVTKDDDFIYCADCEEEKEGECPYHHCSLFWITPLFETAARKIVLASQPLGPSLCTTRK